MGGVAVSVVSSALRWPLSTLIGRLPAPPQGITTHHTYTTVKSLSAYFITPLTHCTANKRWISDDYYILITWLGLWQNKKRRADEKKAEKQRAQLWFYSAGSSVFFSYPFYWQSIRKMLTVSYSVLVLLLTISPGSDICDHVCMYMWPYSSCQRPRRDTWDLDVVAAAGGCY